MKTHRDSQKTRVGVLGASGTAGAELVRLLWQHPRLELTVCAASRSAGLLLNAVAPNAPALPLRHTQEVEPAEVDAIFLALPHGSAAAQAARFLQAGVRVIDLSGDLRLRDSQLHQRTYGSERDETLARRAVYGLTEFNRAAIRDAQLIANPGCYPTCSSFALGPLAERGVLGRLPVIDAKSGISGAGRNPSPTTHYLAVAEQVRPYKLGRSHRHVAEIEQTLAALHANPGWPRIVFCPHVVAMERGMVATCVVQPTCGAEQVRNLLQTRYQSEPFVDLLPAGEVASVAPVHGTNRCVLSVHPVQETAAVVVVSAIDNLVKGAAGQAIQNLNVMLGIPEETGLPGANWGAKTGTA